MRACAKCGTEFEPEPRLGDRHKVCYACVLAAIDDMAAESVLHMSDEEIEAELREDGVDVEALRERMLKTVANAQAKRKT